MPFQAGMRREVIWISDAGWIVIAVGYLCGFLRHMGAL